MSKDIQSHDRKNVTMPRHYLGKDILLHIGNKPVRDITAEDAEQRLESGFSISG